MEPEQKRSLAINHQLEWLRKDIELGFSEIILHNVNLEQEQFIEGFGEKVLPAMSAMGYANARS